MSKLLIIGTCCEGEWTAGTRAQHRFAAAASRAPRSTTLALGSLTLDHVGRYLDARFGPDCLSDVAPAVHHATAGNPFMMVNAILTRDFPIVQGTILVSAVTFVTINLLTDFVYAVLDPRIKYT